MKVQSLFPKVWHCSVLTGMLRSLGVRALDTRKHVHTGDSRHPLVEWKRRQVKINSYLLTSLASLAMKNPKVPSWILRWFPGLINILLSEQKQTKKTHL